MANGTNDQGVNYDKANQGIDTTNAWDFANQTGLYTTAYAQPVDDNNGKFINAYDNPYTYEGGSNWNAPGPGTTLQGTNVLTINDDFNIEDPFYQNSGQGYNFAQNLAKEGGYRTADGTFHEFTPEQIAMYGMGENNTGGTTTTDQGGGTTTTTDGGTSTTTTDGTTTTTDETTTLTPEQQAERTAALEPFLDSQTGQIRADLLGGQFTDPDTIPLEVLRERQNYRERGYLGEWGAGAAGDWQTRGYKGEVDAYGRQTIKGDMVGQFNNPTLPEGAVLQPQLMSVQEGELIGTEGKMLDPNAIAAQMREAATSTAAAPDTAEAASYDAATVTVSDLATVQGQLEELYKDFEGGEVPAWASGAIRAANDAMAARGLGASSIAGQTIMQAAMESALPIAMADSQTYAQALFTNQAAENAALQFNAQNRQQVSQFNAQLKSSVATFNADQTNAMERFNAGEANAISQFNATLQNQREQFNANMSLQIDQSNAQWRRQINTANTAAINAANQFNAQAILDRSNQAMNNLWQEWRDNADYAFKAGENAKDRQANLAIQVLRGQQELDSIAAQQPGVLDSVFGVVGKIVGSEAGSGKIMDWVSSIDWF